MEREIALPASKSIANRVYMLRALRGEKIEAPPGSCNDLLEMAGGLNALNSGQGEIEVKESGTALRFLCAFAAAKCPHSRIVIRCRGRLAERPLGALLDALRSMGAQIREEIGEKGEKRIEFAATEGPLRGGRVVMNNPESSQFISALMLVGSLCKEPLQIEIEGEPASRPYVEMTERVMELFASDASNPLLRESDWSGAAFFYQYVAAGRGGESVVLEGLYPPGVSLQGDARCAELFEPLGVATDFTARGAVVSKTSCAASQASFIERNMSDVPDLVPAFVGAALQSGVRFRLSGLRSLRLKESDRIAALEEGFGRLGYVLCSSADTLSWSGERCASAFDLCFLALPLPTRGDHRIAMALGVFLRRKGRRDVEELLESPGCVDKSFPGFFPLLASL